MAYAKTSERREKRLLREQMRSLGLGYRDIAAEFARRYRLRPRAAWREAYGWSLQDTADRINEFRGNTGLDPGGIASMTAPHLSEYENWPGHGPEPTGRRPTPYLLAILAAVYDCAVTDLVDLADREHLRPADLLILDKYSQTAAVPARVDHGQSAPPAPGRQSEHRQDVPPLDGTLAAAGRDLGAPDIPGLLSLIAGERQEEKDPVRRRTFVGLTGASLVSAMLAESASGRPPAETEALASVLIGHAASLALEPDQPSSTGTLAAEVDAARRAYQACRYSELARLLPGLLGRLNSACAMLPGDARSEACALSADAYHVAAGLLLKLDDQGLASLAADRSMRAAQASGDPVTIGASARIITHTLMSGGHMVAAVSAASSHAARLDHDMKPATPDSLSVYGALLLRGSVAAAHHGNRRIAHELLGEADEAARRLGMDADGNLRWTAFGLANALVHRVNIAVTLGDAGTAIDVARRVDLSKITVTERKATLLLDVSRAFFQWGRHEQAYTALRAAESTAPEEVAGRPSVHRLVRDLRTAAPASIRRDVDQFATRIGVTS
ncbi:MAG: hypothetical protein M3Z75_26810 [Actinomycetota bacterium]|nr:hypothetical protein [Actinomycetota bacterium]